MFKKLAIIFIIASIFYMPLFFTSCSKSKPPRPGPNFVWVVPHTTLDGRQIPGHWMYAGPHISGKIWVTGHNAPDGRWIPGHWKHKPCPKPGAVWVPGHPNPSGRWISGHWK
ncbi:MAG: hypothetical protein U9Q89_06235 [Thermodesulfobacteriota bacterium]|nr:hypothetical protein [Thermodesulfobacteriota bacterium]